MTDTIVKWQASPYLRRPNKLIVERESKNMVWFKAFNGNGLRRVAKVKRGGRERICDSFEDAREYIIGWKLEEVEYRKALLRNAEEELDIAIESKEPHDEKA